MAFYEPVLLSNVTDELATIAVGCQKFGLVCTEQAEFDKYTLVIGIFGIFVGMMSLHMFQYMRGRTKEKIAKQKAKQEKEKLEDNE